MKKMFNSSTQLLSRTFIRKWNFGLILFLLILFMIFKSYLRSEFRKNPFLNSSLSQNIVILWPVISTGSLISNFNGTFVWINLALFSICKYGFENEKIKKKSR